MTALTQNRNTPSKAGVDHNDPVAAATKIYQGSIVCLNAAGNAVPGATATTLIARGRALAYVDNSAGSAGDLAVPTEAGIFRLTNDGSINRSHIGKAAYIVDDQTVAATDGTGTRSVAGRIDDVDAAGVWVEIGR